MATNTTPDHPPPRPARAYIGFVVLSLGMGIALIIGGPERISAPAYEVVVYLGDCYVWGSFYIAIGLAILATAYDIAKLHWALLLGAVGYAILCGAFIIAAIHHPESNLTAIVSYGWISGIHILAAERVRTGSWWTLPSGHP